MLYNIEHLLNNNKNSIHNYKTTSPMKIKTIILTATFGLAVNSYAQSVPSFKDMFLHMPESVCPALTEYNRLELVDNQRNDKVMRTRNIYKTFSTMETLTDTYAHLTESKSAEKTFRLLTCTNPVSADNTKQEQGESASYNIIMVISTVHSDSISDSSVSFYTTKWEPLAAADHYAQAISDKFRVITMANGSDTINVTTTNPLTLNLDGSNTPAKNTPSTTEYFIWNPNTAMFEKASSTDKK